MKVSELKSLLFTNDRHDKKEIKIVIDNPSMGGHDYVLAERIWFGFDWDNGLMIKATEKIVRKENKQDIYEAANDLLMMLATESFVLKKEKYENRRAKQILLKFGYTDEQLRKYVRLFHRDKEIIK